MIGGNPFSGNSHVSKEMDARMEDFFTTKQIKKTLFRCMECGINAMQLRADKHITRMIREFRQEGGNLHWIAQTASEYGSFEGNLALIKACGAIAAYHHGTVTDMLFKAGEYAELVKRFALMRSLGIPVGLGTHMPEVIRYAEEHRWNVDFYMASVYNLSRAERASSAVTGISNENEPFFDEDIPLMYSAIRETAKPCLAFKILGATRRCGSQEQARLAFHEAFTNIKAGDGVVVGMFPTDMDQVKINAGYAEEAISNKELIYS
jgi:hypothetical protein